jgi:hypothetical protein
MYRTTRFKLGMRIDLLEHCFYTAVSPYAPRKISVTFHYLGREQGTTQLDSLYALLDLPDTANIHIILDPVYLKDHNLWKINHLAPSTDKHVQATKVHVGDLRFARMLDVVFPLLERLQAQDFTVMLLLEPKGHFAMWQVWHVKIKMQKGTYVSTPANAVEP